LASGDGPLRRKISHPSYPVKSSSAAFCAVDLSGRKTHIAKPRRADQAVDEVSGCRLRYKDPEFVAGVRHLGSWIAPGSADQSVRSSRSFKSQFEMVACPRFEPSILKVSEFRRTIGGNIAEVWGKAVAVSRLEPPTVRFDPTTLSQRRSIPTKENSLMISVLLETRTCRNTL
jgi:hypothetical protein